MRKGQTLWWRPVGITSAAAAFLWIVFASLVQVPAVWAAEVAPPAAAVHWAAPEYSLMLAMGIADASWQLDEPCDRGRYAAMLAKLSGQSTADELAAEGILSGFPDGELHLDYRVTRAEAATMILRTLRYLQNQGVAGQPQDPSETSEGAIVRFSDIRRHWAESAIVEGTRMGIFKGYGDGTWKPSRPLSTAEAIVMLTRFAYAAPPVASQASADSINAIVPAYYDALAAGISSVPMDFTAAQTYTTGQASHDLAQNLPTLQALAAQGTAVQVAVQDVQTQVLTRSALVAIVQVDRKTVELIDGKATPHDLREVLYLRLTPSGWKIFH